MLSSFCGQAQTGNLFKKAPAGVEEALRARVSQFFTLQQESKFRAAEGCVCDDTKDYFYNLKKKSPRSIEIDKVEFDEGFAGASVLVSIGADIPTMSGIMQVVAPMGTRWRLENGQWCFYATPRQQTSLKTPFGEITSEGQGSSIKPRPMNQAMMRPVTVDDVQTGVLTSAQTVIFDATKPAAAEIELSNSLPGRVQISTEGLMPPGVKVKLTPNELNGRESAKARFEFKPGATIPSEAYIVTFIVEPTRQRLAIKVVFELSQEMKEKLPKPVIPKQ